MTDGHIHLEQGPYTLEWIAQFVDRAVEMQLDEIRLLEHCYRFREFVPMYGSVRAYSDYFSDWLHRRAGLMPLEEYLELVEKVRKAQFPVKIQFGLEVCYFKEYESLIREQTKDAGLDFLLGSIHFVDGFGFDHKPELWEGIDVDSIYRRYFEDSVSLANSGLFDGIGHPDTIKLFGHKPSFSLTESYERLAAALAKNHVYADQNSGAERRNPTTAPLGMAPELLRILKKHNVPIITSSDAHCPQDVGYKIKELTDCIRSCE